MIYSELLFLFHALQQYRQNDFKAHSQPRLSEFTCMTEVSIGIISKRWLKLKPS
jgi:hypothetical protein